MIVTAIEPFERGKGRVSVYLNNEFAFVLYKGELLEYGIEEGTDLTEDLFKRILDEKLYSRAKKRGMNLLKTMDRTENDVRQKLYDSGYPQEAVENAVEYLKSFHYLDDMRYACDYIHFKSSSMSRRQIVNKLTQKGVSKAIIESAYNEMQSLDDGNSEHELIYKLMIKKYKGVLGNISYEDKQKLFAYLYNKGFSISDIEHVYNENCLT